MVQEREAGDSLFNQLSTISPGRVDVAEKDINSSGSLTDNMKVSPKRTDFQVLDDRLFPVLKEGIKWINNIMVGRVFPDTINPLRNILCKHLLRSYSDMSFAEAVFIAEVALSVAIDGEGRIDAIHSFGKIGENNEEIKKGLM